VLKDLGIRGRLLVLTLVPSTLLAVALGLYFTRVQFMDVHQQLYERGQMLAEQLAPMVAPLMAQGRDRSLQLVLNHVLNQRDVRTATVLSPDRNLRAHAGPNMLTPSPPSDPLSLTQVTGTESTRILMPVLGRHLQITEDLMGDETRLIGWLELEMSHEGTLLRGYRSLFTSLVLILIGVTITALLAIRLSRAISQPLLRIKLAVARIKEGRLETRLPSLGSHEMDELASGINSMAEALLRGREELQQSIDQATEDVRQNLETIEVQNIELDMARKEAVVASRIKSEFLANISHEIRTPLSGILGFTHLLQKEPLTPRQQDHLATIETSAKNLLGIINEILDFSKIEAGKLVLETMPFNLRELIEDTLTILAPSAHAKHLELVCLVYRDTPLHLVGDPQRLRQVLTNLISNAIKFTNEGSILIRAMMEDENSEQAQLRISVQDTGIGLSEREIRQLFQAFSQADNSLSRQPGGTGLGLVISKRLIEQMNGEIGVDSAPGKGSTFWISLNLPKAKHHPETSLCILPAERAALLETHALTRQALQHQLEDLGLQVLVFEALEPMLETIHLTQHGNHPIQIALLDQAALPGDPAIPGIFQHLTEQGCQGILLCEQAPHHRPQVEPPVPALAKPVCTRKLQRLLSELAGPQPISPRPAPILLGNQAPRILCVDDNPANLLLVETLLRDLGAHVLAVDNGTAALEAVQQQSFDLVFMDMQMPGMDGRQTTEAIRRWEADRDSPPLPIVALTAHALASEKRTLLQSGLDDYLTKPINEQQLAQVILKWTGLSLHHPQPLPVEHPPLPAIGHSVLDRDEGLRLAAGKAELAKDMLDMLLASLPSERQGILEAQQAGDRPLLIARIHHLHGATHYCGVPQLRQACRRSETLLNQQHPAAEAALRELDEAIGRLLQEAGQHA